MTPMTGSLIQNLLLKFSLLLFAPALLAAGPVWKVSDGAHALYLGGTLHLLRKQDYPLPAAFDQAFDRADKLVFETDIAATRSSTFLLAMDQALRLPAGRKLGDFLSPSTREQIEAKLAQFGQSLASFEAYRPAMLSISLTLMALQKLGIDAPGVDEYYFRRAQKVGKAIGWLESPEQQITFLSTMGGGDEDALIRQTLAEMETLERDYQRMIDAWKEGDLEALEALFLQPMRKISPHIYRVLMVDRNRQWLPKIRAMLEDPGSELILVGSAHLAGPDGLVQALRRQGLRVERLEPAVALTGD